MSTAHPEEYGNIPTLVFVPGCYPVNNGERLKNWIIEGLQGYVFSLDNTLKGEVPRKSLREDSKVIMNEDGISFEKTIEDVVGDSESGKIKLVELLNRGKEISSIIKKNDYGTGPIEMTVREILGYAQ